MANKLISTASLLAALALTAPAFAQDASSAPMDQGGMSAEAGASVEGGASAEVGTSAEPNGGAQENIDVNLTTEQQTQIRQSITELNVAPVTVNFDINIGVVVPQTVVLQPLPATVIKVLPRFKGYLFFLLPDGRIVIVSPSTHKIVLIILVK